MATTTSTAAAPSTASNMRRRRRRSAVRRVGLLGLDAGRPRGLAPLLLGGLVFGAHHPMVAHHESAGVRSGWAAASWGETEAAATLISARRGVILRMSCDG